jgi:hypothetical protein
MKNLFLIKTIIGLAILSFWINSCKKENTESILGDCSVEPASTIPTISKFGMSPTYKGDFEDWNTADFIESLNLISQLGAEIVHYGFLWSELQIDEQTFEWSFTDQVFQTVEQNGQKLSVIVPVINTTDTDDLPEHISFTTFTDSDFISAYTDFYSYIS